MKLGLGLYRHMLDRDHYRFARQAGATHIVAHLSDYFRPGSLSTASGDDVLGQATGSTHWTYDELDALRQAINDEGLELAAIENFDAGHWHDVLLDGPRKREQLENIKRTIRCIKQHITLALDTRGGPGDSLARGRGLVLDT